MRIVMMGLVSLLLGTACGKKVEPTAAADAAPVAAADTAPAPAADTAQAPAPDTAPAAADTAQAPAPDVAPAADVAPTADAAPTGDAPAGDAGDTTEGPREPTPPPKPFHDMSVEEQKDHMKKVVMPVMRPRFQAFDAEEFAKFTCATCHGPGAKEGKFELPNPELTKLPSTPEGWDELAKKEGEALKFMKEVVTPAMATMIGEPLFDPATQKGFGCFECHTKQ